MSAANEFGKNLGWLLSSGVDSFNGAMDSVKDASKKVGEYGLDVAEHAAKGVVKGIGDTADLVGDVAAGAANLASGIAGKGDVVYADGKKGWIDRGNAKLGKILDEHKVVDSELGKTDLGKMGLKGAELVGEFLAPGWVAGKGVKAGKAALDFKRVAKEAPDAYKKLLEAQKAAKAAGKTFTETDAAKMLDELAPDVAKAVRGTVANEGYAAKSALKKSGEAEGKLKEVGEKYGTPESAGGSRKVAKDARKEAGEDSVLKEADKLDAESRSALHGLTEKYDPKEIATWSKTHPKLSKLLSMGGKATLGIAALLSRHTPDEVEAKVAEAEDADTIKDPDGMLPDHDTNEVAKPSEGEAAKQRFTTKSADGTVRNFSSSDARERYQNHNRIRGVDQTADGKGAQ